MNIWVSIRWSKIVVWCFLAQVECYMGWLALMLHTSNAPTPYPISLSLYIYIYLCYMRWLALRDHESMQCREQANLHCASSCVYTYKYFSHAKESKRSSLGDITRKQQRTGVAGHARGTAGMATGSTAGMATGSMATAGMATCAASMATAGMATAR